MPSAAGHRSPLIADTAYDPQERVVVPREPSRQRCRHPFPPHPQAPARHDRHLCQTRHLTENLFNRIKQCRASAPRYDKTACNFLSAIYWLPWWSS